MENIERVSNELVELYQSNIEYSAERIQRTVIEFIGTGWTTGRREDLEAAFKSSLPDTQNDRFEFFLEQIRLNPG